MRQLLSLFCAALLAAAFTDLAAAPNPIPAPPSLAADSYVLMDVPSGDLLVEVNKDQPIEPASLTKIMTAYVVYGELASGRIDLDDQVPISERAWRMKGSRMFLEAGTQVSVRKLLKGLIVQSGNDACVALAEYVAGTEAAFADLMNAQANALGMNHSHFVNATGWPHPDHYSTAHDIALLSRALIRDYPSHYSWYADKEYTYGGISQPNRNRLLWRDASVDGIKTGHTEGAGYCLAVSAVRDDQRLISVVLGAASDEARTDASLALLNYGFRFFDSHRLYSAGKALTHARLWGGEQTEVPLGLKQDLYVAIEQGRFDDLQADMQLLPEVEAPVASGAELGQVNISLDGERVATRPLVALEPVAEGGIWRWAVDSVLRLIQF